jgi:hypothetical protein
LTLDHPVCVKDASYFWYGANQVIATQNHYQDFLPTPAPELAKDILRNRPLALSKRFLGHNSVNGSEINALLESSYDDEGWVWLRRDRQEKE